VQIHIYHKHSVSVFHETLFTLRFMFSRRRVWTLVPSGMWRRVVYWRIRRTDCIHHHQSSFIYTDDRGRLFLCNVGKLPPDYTALQPRRKWFSSLKLAGRREYLARILRKESSNHLPVQCYLLEVHRSGSPTSYATFAFVIWVFSLYACNFVAENIRNFATTGQDPK
jgi:hypothetical protein